MMLVFSRLKKWMTAILNTGLIFAVALLVLDVIWGVLTRYVLGEQTRWTEELARFLLVWISLLGGAVAFGTKGHLGVDYFVGKLHPDSGRLMTVIAHLAILFFAVAIFLLGGSRVVSDALAMEQVAPALGWKMGYIYLALPVAGIFIVLYTVENLIETLTAPAEKLQEATDIEGEM